ncbi:MAG TPA: hypothetical protein VJB98_03380 [Candidatus Paceibacterota bacterium]
MTGTTFQGIMDIVRESWEFEKEDYPGIAKRRGGTVPEDNQIAHVVLHIAKSLGKTAELFERADHGEPLDEDALKEIAAKQVVNALRLAGLSGMSTADLVRRIHEWAGSKRK